MYNRAELLKSKGGGQLSWPELQQRLEPFQKLDRSWKQFVQRYKRLQSPSIPYTVEGVDTLESTHKQAVNQLQMQTQVLSLLTSLCLIALYTQTALYSTNKSIFQTKQLQAVSRSLYLLVLNQRLGTTARIRAAIAIRHLGKVCNTSVL